MSLLTKKICLIGSFSVGKTSLTRRFVSNTFSAQYLTTVGVKIETKTLTLSPEQQVKFVVWDIAGENELSSASKSYLQGASGYLLIADGTRKNTLATAMELHKTVQELLPNTPCVGLLNKADLDGEWDIGPEEHQQWPSLAQWKKASALTGENVEEAFLLLAEKIVAGK